MTEIKRLLNLVVIYIIFFVLLAAYAHQYLANELPCPLCMLQRVGMIGVASGAFMNLRFGLKGSHYGLIIFSALFGMSVSLRQISFHACPNFPTFGTPVLGLSLYVWAFIVFFCCIFGVALVQILHVDSKDNQEHLHLTVPEKLGAFLLIFITFANVVTTALQCGISPCQG